MRQMTAFLSLAILMQCISFRIQAQDLPAAVDRSVDFAIDVRPIFEKHCWSCHGIEKQESGLRLDSRELMLHGGDLGKVIEIGKSADSRLIHFVAGINPDKVMPPEGDRLTAEQTGILRAWIDQGGVWPDSTSDSHAKNMHWAYQPLSVQAPPENQNPQWPVNVIDRFVLAELEKQGLAPSPEASRHTLIRRLYLDLTGLLPTVKDVDSFVSATQPNAYEVVVDQLLASPHFGERWGRHWLDMARYADSDGYEKDNPRPDAYLWRDWVIDAINSDIPFDQFTIEQLAGDLLPEATSAQRLATAFHRQTLTNTEGGTDQEQFRVEACFDRTETTGSVWLGLTVGCARCHTHKYDAITQREYYQLFSIFNNGDEQTAVVPKSEAEVAEYAKAKVKFESDVAELASRVRAAQEERAPEFMAWQQKTKAFLAENSRNPVKLYVLNQIAHSADAGVTFEPRDDNTVLVRGENPERVIYTIEGKTDVGEFSGIRLDVFPDPSLPANGPGRVSHGNFVLSEVTLEVASDATFTDARRLEFARAKADFEQEDRSWPAKDVIDGKDNTGWAIGPQFGRPHWLVLALKEPLKAAEPVFLRIRLSQQYGVQHTIGRFRLSVQSGYDPDSALPDNILQALKATTPTPTEDQNQQLLDYFSRLESPTKELLAQLDEMKKKEPAKPEMAVRVIAQREKDLRKTFVLKRGEFLDPITELEVEPAGLATLPPMTSRRDSAAPDRMDMARWLVSRENPLTPRVTANHVWRVLFGRGLVRTLNDFGVRGEKPTHPELLDWLAADFMSGSGSGRPWSRKALIRQIVMSATYRQSSRFRPELADLDPQNLLLARQNRLRVEAEIVRDISLDVSGLLSHKIGGPSVYPPLPPGIAELSYAGNFKWTESTGEDRYRRGMYTFFKRTSPHPNLVTFDCPDANLTCIERQTSNTPLQALTSLNNETFAETSRAFSRRILTLPESDDTSRLALAFRMCVARPGNASELQQLHALLNESRDWYQVHPDQALQLIGKDSASETAPHIQAAWIATSRILLNLDEFITRE